MSAIQEALKLIESLAPFGAPVTVRDALEDDECRWFLEAVSRSVVTFRECPPSCFRFKKWGVAGPDHFDTPLGKPRHLFSKPAKDVAWLNREYVPHIAAYGRAIIDFGYEPTNRRFPCTGASLAISS